ncbi:MAG: hypothetical protein NVS9B4_01280 [Candidatus Acidiferrum sp.]
MSLYHDVSDMENPIECDSCPAIVGEPHYPDCPYFEAPDASWSAIWQGEVQADTKEDAAE